MGELRVAGRTGDVRVGWDPDDLAAVEQARAVFGREVGRGASAFAVEGEGKRGRRIDAFDPSLREIVIVPRMAGG